MAFGTPRRIDVKYDAETVQNMLLLLKASPFPDKAPIDANTPWKLGIEYEYLKKLRETFLTQWSWETLEKRIAKFENYLVHYENAGDVLDLHFVHAKSSRSDAIPLLLLHGWPGTFYDFHKVIGMLANPPSSKLPAFHVVVPSLPGYFLSTLPRRDGWDLTDTAQVFNGLMTSVLGYTKYMGQAGDWGSWILRVMGCLFPDSVTLMHFNMFETPITPKDPFIYLSEVEEHIVARRDEFAKTGRGYNIIQTTKPFTIGIAIGSSPLALLAYIGEKIYGWSHPDRIDVEDVLDTVALYYLSGCFPTSVVIYNQSNELAMQVKENKENKWLLKNKFCFSAFPYEIGGSPRTDIQQYGPLAYYIEHRSGGHFPALDSPVELIDDLMEFAAENWARA